MTTRQLGTWRSSDAPGYRCSPSGPGRARDQEQEAEPEGGRLVCRIVEDRAGNLHIVDAGRLRLRARRARDGRTVEIFRHEGEETEDQADPEIVGTAPGLSGDPARAAAADALTNYRRTGRPEFHMGGLAEYQRRLDPLMSRWRVSA